jgi:hypothetical protein
MKHFSFLLGSGFSAPDGLLTTTQINERLKKINADEIKIHTSMNARFLNDEVDLNPWSNAEEKLFVQRFLEFYNEQKLGGNPFHYEDFYDFYYELHQTETLDEKCQKFFDDYRNETKLEDDHHNLLMRFNFTFNQLLSKLLYKWPVQVSFANECEPKYTEFLNLLEELKKNYKIHLHSLNHDLLVEKLSHSFTIGKNLSDGFEEIGSPFYGDHFHSDKNEDITKVVHTVRLRRFTNEFSKPFCLYKLHGSVDNYDFNFENKEYTMIKIPYGVQKENMRMEYFNKAGKRDYYADNFQIMPDFLSGTSTKVLSYERNNYYKPLFNHFTDNLIESEFLVVIGYGFGDTKINEYLVDAFLVDESKRIVVVDIKKPASALMENKNVKFIEKNISDVTREDIYNGMKN